jgi:hypothetical protein
MKRSSYAKHSCLPLRSFERNPNKSRLLASAMMGLCILAASSSLTFGGEIMPDFTLTDVNPTSSTYDPTVSPRNFMGKVSGYYFGFAT